MITVPVTHDLTYLATIDTARLPLSLDEVVAEESVGLAQRYMVDIAVQGRVAPNTSLAIALPLSSRGTSAVLISQARKSTASQIN